MFVPWTLQIFRSSPDRRQCWWCNTNTRLSPTDTCCINEQWHSNILRLKRYNLAAMQCSETHSTSGFFMRVFFFFFKDPITQRFSIGCKSSKLHPFRSGWSCRGSIPNYRGSVHCHSAAEWTLMGHLDNGLQVSNLQSEQSVNGSNISIFTEPFLKQSWNDPAVGCRAARWSQFDQV